MGALFWLGLVLVLLWLVGAIVFKIAGLLVHLLLLAGLALLVVWAVRRLL